MRKLVVLVIGSLEIGGAESQMAMLAEGLVSRGWTVEVFALDAGGPLRGRLARAGVRVLGGRRGFDSAPLLARLARLALDWAHLAFHCARNRPLVIHAYLPLTNFIGAIAARAARVPVVVTSRRGLGNHQDRHPGLKWMDRVANRLSSRVTANSTAVAADVHRRDNYPQSDIVVIPNGLNLGTFASVRGRRAPLRQELGLAAEDIAIVKIGNLIPYKGHADLIEAFMRVNSMVPEAKLFLVGQDRGMRSGLAARLEALSLGAKVWFLGERNDVPALLAAMDLGVMASHEEGLSNALIEKLAAGLPAVATDVGGNAEVLEGMPNCRLARAHDPGDLARALLETIAVLPEQHGEPEARRRRVRERYAMDSMIDRYERLYLESASR